MEKILTTLIAGLILWLSALPAIAQKGARKTPRWVPEKGYWVVERRNDSCFVYFYSDDNQLLQKEQLDRPLNAARRRVKWRLKRTLERVVEESISRQNKPIYRQMMNGDASAVGQP